jgi:hypothetical protein
MDPYRRPARGLPATLVRLIEGANRALPKAAAELSRPVRRALIGRGSRRFHAELVLEHLARPYPVVDYELWLCSDRPLLDVVLRAGMVDPWLLRRAAAVVDPGIELTWIDSRCFRVAIPPVRIVDIERGALRFGGDRARLRAFLDRLVDPLHDDVGVAVIDMGGTLSRPMHR